MHQSGSLPAQDLVEAASPGDLSSCTCGWNSQKSNFSVDSPRVFSVVYGTFLTHQACYTSTQSDLFLGGCDCEQKLTGSMNRNDWQRFKKMWWMLRSSALATAFEEYLLLRTWRQSLIENLISQSIICYLNSLKNISL